MLTRDSATSLAFLMSNSLFLASNSFFLASLSLKGSLRFCVFRVSFVFLGAGAEGSAL